MNTDRSQIQLGVGAVIINDEGKVFLGKRGKNVSINSGKWESPGGRLEFGETLVESVKREVQEEHGIDVEVGEMIGIVEYIHPQDGHWVGPAFVCTITHGEPKICEPDKCEEIGWFSLEEAFQLPLTSFAEKDLANYRHWLQSRTANTQ